MKARYNSIIILVVLVALSASILFSADPAVQAGSGNAVQMPPQEVNVLAQSQSKKPSYAGPHVQSRREQLVPDH